jgi:hypothetical protein
LAGQGGWVLAQALEPVSDKDKAKSDVGDSIEWGFAKPGGVLPPAVDLIEGGGLRLPGGEKQAPSTSPVTEEDKKGTGEVGGK